MDDGRVGATCRTDGLLARVTREWLDDALNVLFFGGGGLVARFLDGLPTDLLILGGDVVVTVAIVGTAMGGVEELGGIVMGVGRSTHLRFPLRRTSFGPDNWIGTIIKDKTTTMEFKSAIQHKFDKEIDTAGFQSN
jgi:hypothetical protein